MFLFIIEAKYSLCIWFAESGDFGIGYWEYSNMGLFTAELREGAWYMWALFKYSKTEWGSAHKIEYLWKWFLLYASISQISKLHLSSKLLGEGRVRKLPYSNLLLHTTSKSIQINQLSFQMTERTHVPKWICSNTRNWGVRNLCGFGQLSRSWGISNLLPPVSGAPPAFNWISDIILSAPNIRLLATSTALHRPISKEQRQTFTEGEIIHRPAGVGHSHF